MLNETEKKILALLQKRNLATKGELAGLVGNGADLVLGRLKERGFVDQVQNLGTCYVITKIGLKALQGE